MALLSNGCLSSLLPAMLKGTVLRRRNLSCFRESVPHDIAWIPGFSKLVIILFLGLPDGRASMIIFTTLQRVTMWISQPRSYELAEENSDEKKQM